MKHDNQQESEESEDISHLVEELGKIGFKAASKSSSLVRGEEPCSTPRGPQRLPRLEVSDLSSILSQDSFHSCRTSETAVCGIAISEEYVIHDR